MSRPKKIAFFIDALGWGGAERSLLALLNHLDLTELDIDIYTLPNACILPEAGDSLPGKVRLRSVPMRSNRLWLRSCQIAYSLMIRLLPRLGVRKHLAEVFWRTMSSAFPRLDMTYDVVVSYQQGIMTYYVADKVEAPKKMAWINSQLSGHGHDVKYSRKFYDKYDHVVAVCEELKRLLSDSGYVDSSSLVTIYDIIEEDAIREKSLDSVESGDFRNWTIVTVARLAPEKNIGLAIDAAAILKDKGVEFTWIIVGGGDDEAGLRHRTETLGLTDCVTFVGARDNPYKYMKKADIYVQTSRNEGYGLTIAEARILGRPVVSTNFPMIYDQIEHGHNGLIADMTPVSVAENIMKLISDESLRKSIEKNLSEERNLTPLTEPGKFIHLINT